MGLFEGNRDVGFGPVIWCVLLLVAVCDARRAPQVQAVRNERGTPVDDYQCLGIIYL